ncbi:MAG TPA: dynamin family protein [Candidatus Ozemobacteraceae bacterium]|nr:dynamin family protein [Candidatus Ozemobacteraceae bacterium]
MTENKASERFLELVPPLKAIAGRMLLDIGDHQLLLNRIGRSPHVLVVGEFNAGKSSLINSMLGEDLLPTGVTPTTSLVTILEPGPFNVHVKPMGTKDPIRIEPGKSHTPGYGIPGGSFDWESFAKLLTDPENIDRIELVRMSHPAMPAGLTVIDTPGINDIAKSRAEIVYGLIPTADVVIFVISALKPFSESERLFLEERLLANDLKKLVFVVNRIDEVEAEERDALVAEIRRSLVAALNTSYDKINARLGQTLYVPVLDVEVFPVCAREKAPVDGPARSRSIGFDPGRKPAGSFCDANRRLWHRIQEICGKRREVEIEAMLHHYLRRGILRIEHALEERLEADTIGKSAVSARLKENAGLLEKLRTTLRQAEGKISAAENDLKQTFHDQIGRAIGDLTALNRLQRDPLVVNTRLKELYEYITTRMKCTLDQLYAELGQSFDAVLDDKRFVEQRSLSIQYDLSDVPGKIVSSLSFAYLAAIFFGVSVGMFAGAAYFASQVIANKRSVKEFFQHATVSEETLLEMKNDLVDKVGLEVEYAVDFIRQSLIQRVDMVQTEIRSQVRTLTSERSFDINAVRAELEPLRKKINAFMAAGT